LKYRHSLSDVPLIWARRGSVGRITHLRPSSTCPSDSRSRARLRRSIGSIRISWFLWTRRARAEQRKTGSSRVIRRPGSGRLGVAEPICKSDRPDYPIEGVRARDGSLYGYLQKITFPEGNSLELINPSDTSKASNHLTRRILYEARFLLGNYRGYTSRVCSCSTAAHRGCAPGSQRHLGIRNRPASVALKKGVRWESLDQELDQSSRRPAKTPVPGALPSTAAPSYKPEFQVKVKYLSENESKVDQVSIAVNRVSTCRFAAQDCSTAGRVDFLLRRHLGRSLSHNSHRRPRAPGRCESDLLRDSVGHWDGDKLVVDVTNFVEDTWFGEEGYFHTAAMHVTERFWRNGENLCISSRWMIPVC